MENMQCDYCGQPAIIIDSHTGIKFCAWCYSATYTCGACINGTLCDFETNPSPLPKQVPKTVRQGNMVMQTIEKNEQRIRETCQKGCPCFHEDFGCLKQNNICGNYKEVKP